MLKRLFLSLVLLAGLASSAFAAGTVPGFSLQRMVDNTGAPLVNCKLYVIQAGTTSTPQNAYQDSGLTIALPNPISCDGNGWLPQFFVADGSIKLRLTDSNGNQQLVADNILVVGPSGGSGGGASVDPTTILATGDMKIAYSTGALAGFVRCNGRTIGSATSGATERANSDTQALFEFLWDADPNLVVSGGRGTSAANDWSANKTITLPDCRGRAIAGLDDMGNSAAGVLTTTYAGCSSVTTLGESCGSQNQILTLAQLPTGITSSNPSQAISVTTTQKVLNGPNTGSAVAGGTQLTLADPGSGAEATLLSSTGNNSISVTSNNTSGSAHPIVPPEMLMTIYIKL